MSNNFIVCFVISICFFESGLSGIVYNEYGEQYSDIIKLLVRVLLLIGIVPMLRIRIKDFNICMFTAILIFLLGSQIVDARVSILILIPYALYMIFFGYVATVYYKNSVSITFKWMFIINSFFVVFQFLGIFEIFYLHQNFTDDQVSDISFLQVADYMPNQQHRPHGIFSNTIALSVFQIMFFFYNYFHDPYSKKFNIFVGFVFCLFGSSTSLAISLCSIFLGITKKSSLYIFCGWILGIIFLFVLFPNFIEINYNVINFLRSFEVRFDEGYNNNFFQLAGFQENLYAIVIFAVISAAAIAFSRIKIYAILIILVGLLSPLFLHPILLDIKYSLYYGLMILPFNNLTNKLINKS